MKRTPSDRTPSELISRNTPSESTPSDGLKRIVEMAKELVRRADNLKILEEELKDAKKDYLRIEREDLPTLMTEFGLKELQLDNGYTVAIAQDVDCGIKEANKPFAFKWLVENGFGGLIKTEVSVKFERGDHESAIQARDLLVAEYGIAELVEAVHPGTLKSFVKEQMTDGHTIPMDLFSVFPYAKAKIKKG